MNEDRLQEIEATQSSALVIDCRITELCRALRESQAEVTRLREAAKMALDEHYKYAKECRADWSNYDGRSHLAHARYIQNLYDEALKETKP